jgi:SNF2 family DNA or RNA helicase/predicted RNA-binding Zn-ribbon protein involved in translation (DUF1610 family)
MQLTYSNCTSCKTTIPVKITSFNYDQLECGHWMKDVQRTQALAHPKEIVKRQDAYQTPKITYQPTRTVTKKNTFEHTIYTAKEIRTVILSSGKQITLSRVRSVFKTRKVVKELKPTTNVDPIFAKGFGYQKEGVWFAENAFKLGYRGCLIADEMALGKTIQALLYVRRHLEECTPTLYIVPGSLTYNWAKEYMQWVLGDLKYDFSKDPFSLPIIHTDGQIGLMPGFKHYFISMDLLSKPKVLASIKAFGFKLAVIDECHKFKNQKSKRTETLMDEIVEKIPNFILLSGTPIENKFTEYETPLTICDPNYWDAWQIKRFTEYGPKNKALGILKYRVKEFFEKTAPYVIRRKRKDVLKDLPEVVIDKKLISVNTNKEFVGAYNSILDELDKLLNQKKAEAGQSMYVLALLQKLRHITGLMKVAAATDFIEEFTLSKEPGEKLAIGVQHQDVGDYFVKLLERLYNLTPVRSDGRDSAIEKMKKETMFSHPNNRFAVLGIPSWGEGRNLQFCPNFLVVERQWKPSLEKQFELRFSRPLKCKVCGALYKKQTETLWECQSCGDLHSQNGVMGTYLCAKDTIDEFF